MILNELKQHGTENFPVEFYHITKDHPKYEMAYHWHGEVELVRILKGELRLMLDNREYTVSRGQSVFINSETVHGAIPVDCEYQCIVFNPMYLSVGETECKSFIENVMSHTLYVNEIHLQDEERYQRVVNTLFDAIQKQERGYTLKVTGCLFELFGEILESGAYSENITINAIHNEKNVIMLKKALAFIRNSYDTQIALADIARAAGISPKYLCTFFKEMTGKTPFEYLNVYRVERAARRLINSDAPVTEIAFACGFNDLSYFIKTFKSIKGVTPKNFRKNVDK